MSSMILCGVSMWHLITKIFNDNLKGVIEIKIRFTLRKTQLKELIKISEKKKIQLLFKIYTFILHISIINAYVYFFMNSYLAKLS